MIQVEKQKRNRIIMISSFVCLILVFVISVATGYVSLTPSQLGRTIIGQGTDRENLILFGFRLPRIMIAVLAGAGLAVSGAILQSITRNPLSEPGILGINAGSGLMVVIYVMFFSAESSNFIYILPFIALIGGVLTALVIYFMAYKKGGGIDPSTLVLIGVGMAAALYGALLTLSIRLERQQYDFFANWLAGRIWGDDWIFVLALLPWIVLLLPYVFIKSNVLNTLSLNEHISIGLGVRVEKERVVLIFISVALASASVSVSGGIAFIGLMAPHISRGLVGPRHQTFLPIAALIGAILLLAADTVGRVILDPSGIPAGIIVTVIGAPYFMYLMVKK
ncbi:iron ABC transporter permease [Bacillus sp. MUM 13]|uniref:FecCD family ABC transporter permease n=1 Tax=Bacillus sp. MUM 13 TaxID=1678001 RepID=UPI0008F57DB7|nr:iron ABC transporter permease [Bacillus sp. MUM 13]OIK06640.1 iron ABC transporter permease [Bacillus sp. MUM 13]